RKWLPSRNRVGAVNLRFRPDILRQSKFRLSSMWIVKLALRRPYTIAVMAILLVVMGVLSASRMVVDIFPAIDIPVVAVVWNYPGLSAEDMERRVVIISERAYSSTVDGISRIEMPSIPG